MKEIGQTLTSVEVAEMVGKDHSKLLRDVRNYIEHLNQSKIGFVDFFTESTYLDGKNESRPCYLVSKKGCEFIANKLTGIKGTEFTAKYIIKFHAMEETIKDNLLDGLSTEMQALIMQDKKIQSVIAHVNKTDDRVDKLENNMTIDYGQQKVLERLVNVTVISALGGKDSNAYKAIGKKVFKECNKDIQDRFDVNSRCNVPKIKFEEACNYIKRWLPCTNTKMMIEDYNNQINIA